MKLLFKATKDGKKSTDFHNKCDGKSHQLIFIKTKSGLIFGGYTKEGYKSKENSVKDSKAFVFSVSKKKIYNSKNDVNTIYDSKNYGPIFLGSKYNTIKIQSNMLDDKSNTCITSESYFEGFTNDYELNNGSKYFIIEEIEVFQVIFI